MSGFDELQVAVERGEREAVVSMVKDALYGGTDPADILNDGLIAAMQAVGEKMEEGDMFIPEVLRAAKTMPAGLEILEPHRGEGTVESAGKVVVGTVKGDVHDIGKNLVGMMLTSAGFDVVDLGRDVAPEDFVEAVDSNGADILGMSALLTTTMPMMIETLAALESNSRRDKVKVMIGGAPVSRGYAEEIGADAYASDAGAAIKTAEDSSHDSHWRTDQY